MTGIVCFVAGAVFGLFIGILMVTATLGAAVDRFGTRIFDSVGNEFDNSDEDEE